MFLRYVVPEFAIGYQKKIFKFLEWLSRKRPEKVKKELNKILLF